MGVDLVSRDLVQRCEGVGMGARGAHRAGRLPSECLNNARTRPWDAGAARRWGGTTRLSAVDGYHRTHEPRPPTRWALAMAAGGWTLVVGA